MSTLQQIREGLSQAWDRVVEGWDQLSRNASGAMTRFKVGRGNNADEARELAERSTGWGLLAAEVFEDDDHVVVRVEAPGMSKDDIRLEVQDDFLVVSGEKHMASERSEGRWQVTECAYGSFQRVVPLPGPVDTTRADATYRNGVLRVELPKSADHRRKVQVTVH
ncbi:MAG: Hsp20/alpha crystallin family protein [Thiohalocapsa sp.]|jgi:HSP20 family protein|uniref:Hsp20/alpha crystallin family protein n=1 Tax=Thiohalocapsa sp. TaxID=2497641 RepID=UPI0025F135B6|nr:Hsp20/alpha crystallin family protein [Thiohalocapsa sp.]MCG6941339.1 Hsp20/alpha crystallin family protein [Thiohalocapsa sp.]